MSKKPPRFLNRPIFRKTCIVHNILEFRPCIASHYKVSADIKRNIFSPLTIDTQRDPWKTERSCHKFDASINDVLKFFKMVNVLFFKSTYLLFVYGLDLDNVLIKYLNGKLNDGYEYPLFFSELTFCT